MYDIFNNHRVIALASGVQQSDITAVQYPTADVVDMWENTQLPNRALLIIDAITLGGATLDIVVQDSVDDVTYDADYATIAQIDADGLYLADLVDFERYLNFYVTVNQTATFSMYLITFEDQRRPVTQDGTMLTITYGSPRKPKVAAS